MLEKCPVFEGVANLSQTIVRLYAIGTMHSGSPLDLTDFSTTKSRLFLPPPKIHKNQKMIKINDRQDQNCSHLEPKWPPSRQLGGLQSMPPYCPASTAFSCSCRPKSYISNLNLKTTRKCLKIAHRMASFNRVMWNITSQND